MARVNGMLGAVALMFIVVSASAFSSSFTEEKFGSKFAAKLNEKSLLNSFDAVVYFKKHLAQVTCIALEKNF